MEILEIERRFLVDLPLRWYGKFKVLTAPKSKIYQTYLVEPDEENSRVRYIVDGGDLRNISRSHYTYTRKTFVSPGINKEIETDLTQSQYRDKLVLQDVSRNRITKTRYCIDFDNRKFELDVFEDRLVGLAILEIELKSMTEEVLLPPYLKVGKEVTDDKFYSNRSLATLESYSIKTNKFQRRFD